MEIRIGAWKMKAYIYWDWKIFGLGVRWQGYNQAIFIECLFMSIDIHFNSKVTN